MQARSAPFKRKRLSLLAAFPATLIAIMLWLAEQENVLAASAVVQGTNHPFVGVVVLVLGALSLGGAAVAIRAIIRHYIPPLPGENIAETVIRWINEEAPDPVDVRRAKLALPPGPARISTSTKIVVAAASLAALGAVSAIVSLATHAPVKVATPHLAPVVAGTCTPAPCAKAANVEVRVVSVNNNYVPTDLTLVQRGIEDGAQPPPGFRFVRLNVVVERSPTAPVLHPSTSFVLLDGSGIRRADVLTFDPACQRRVMNLHATTVGPFPLCFAAKGNPGRIDLGIPVVGLSISL